VIETEKYLYDLCHNNHMQDFNSFDSFILSLKQSEKAIIVEGDKDKAALAKYGISRVYTLSKFSLFKICEMIASNYDEAVILTDFDKKGRQLYSKLKKNLEKVGIKVDMEYREWLRKNTRISHIEGLRRNEPEIKGVKCNSEVG